MEEKKPTIKTKKELPKRKEGIQKCVMSTKLKEKEYLMEALVNRTTWHREVEMRTENSRGI